MPGSTLIDIFAQCALGEMPGGPGPLRVLPGKVHMLRSESEAAEHFLAGMRSLGIQVEIKQKLDHLEEFGRFIAEQSIDGFDVGEALLGEFAPPRVDGLIETKCMEIERIRAFAEAAAEFFRAKPWDRRPHGVLWRILPKPKWQEFAYAMVIGDGGETFGLAFLPSVQFMERMATQGLEMEFDGGRNYTVWSMLFDSIDAAPESDVALWEHDGLALAGEDAFPYPIGITPSGLAKRPTPEKLTFMEAMLRAVTRADHSKLGVLNGEYTIEVPSFAGPVGITLKSVVILDDVEDDEA